MDVTTNSNLCRFQTNDVRQAARHNIENHEEIVKRVRDTFKPTKDFFEKMTEQTVAVCDCYTNYQITTNMPENVFSDSFGYAMQHDIADRMEDYYAGKMSDDELKQYFNDCCSDMRIYRRSSTRLREMQTMIICRLSARYMKFLLRKTRGQPAMRIITKGHRPMHPTVAIIGMMTGFTIMRITITNVGK